MTHFLPDFMWFVFIWNVIDPRTHEERNANAMVASNRCHLRFADNLYIVHSKTCNLQNRRRRKKRTLAGQLPVQSAVWLSLQLLLEKCHFPFHFSTSNRSARAKVEQRNFLRTHWDWTVVVTSRSRGRRSQFGFPIKNGRGGSWWRIVGFDSFKWY